MLLRTRTYKLKTIIIFIVAITVVVSYTAAAMVLYVNTSDFLKEKVINSSYSNALQISKKVEMCFSEIENLTKRISTSNDLKEYIKEYYQRKHIPFDKVYLTDEIISFLNNARKYARGVESITIVLPGEQFYVGKDSGHIIISYDDLKNTDLYNLISNSEKPVLIYLDEDILQSDNPAKDNVLSKGNTLFASKIASNGILILKINDNWVNTILEENNQAAIIDSKNVLWKGKQVKDIQASKVFENMKNKDSGVIEGLFGGRDFFKKLSWGDWYLLYIEELESGNSSRKFITFYIVLTFLISVLISAIVSKFTLNRLIEPINSLVNNIRKYKSNEDTGTFLSIKTGKYGMRERILLYYFMVVIIPLVFFVFSYILFSKSTIQNEIIESEKTAFSQTAENISLLMDGKLKAISSMCFDKSIQNALVEEKEKIETGQLYQVLNNYMLLTNGYDDISIINMNGDTILSTYNNNKNYNSDSELLKWNDKTDIIFWQNTKR